MSLLHRPNTTGRYLCPKLYHSAIQYFYRLMFSDYFRPYRNKQFWKVFPSPSKTSSLTGDRTKKKNFEFNFFYCPPPHLKANTRTLFEEREQLLSVYLYPCYAKRYRWHFRCRLRCVFFHRQWNIYFQSRNRQPDLRAIRNLRNTHKKKPQSTHTFFLIEF